VECQFSRYWIKSIIPNCITYTYPYKVTSTLRRFFVYITHAYILAHFLNSGASIYPIGTLPYLNRCVDVQLYSQFTSIPLTIGCNYLHLSEGYRSISVLFYLFKAFHLYCIRVIHMYPSTLRRFLVCTTHAHLIPSTYQLYSSTTLKKQLHPIC
jgi:hypothetical protein